MGIYLTIEIDCSEDYCQDDEIDICKYAALDSGRPVCSLFWSTALKGDEIRYAFGTALEREGNKFIRCNACKRAEETNRKVCQMEDDLKLIKEKLGME